MRGSDADGEAIRTWRRTDKAGMDRLTAYGHSWVQGDGATDSRRCLVEVAARLLGCAPDNQGRGGSLSTGTAGLLGEEPPPWSSVYLVMTGLNDVRLNGPSAAALGLYTSALRAILRTLLPVNPAAQVVMVEQPHLLEYSLHAPHNRGSDRDVDVYNSRLRLVADAHPRVRVATVDLWDPGRMLSDDTVHPNDDGHAEVAHAVLAALRLTWSQA